MVGSSEHTICYLQLLTAIQVWSRNLSEVWGSKTSGLACFRDWISEVSPCQVSSFWKHQKHWKRVSPDKASKMRTLGERYSRFLTDTVGPNLNKNLFAPLDHRPCMFIINITVELFICLSSNTQCQNEVPPVKDTFGKDGDCKGNPSINGCHTC